MANNHFEGLCYLLLGGCWLFLFYFIMVKIKHFLFLRGMLGGFFLGFLVGGGASYSPPPIPCMILDIIILLFDVILIFIISVAFVYGV